MERLNTSRLKSLSVFADLSIALRVSPKTMIMENVPAIQSMKHESGLRYPEYTKNCYRKMDIMLRPFSWKEKRLV